MATEADKVNSGALATLIFVGAFAMVGISLVLVALVRDQVAEEFSQKDVGAGQQYQSLRSAQLEKLESGGTIQAAMQSVLDDLQRDPASATPGNPGEKDAPTEGDAPDTEPAGQAEPAGQKDGTLSPEPPQHEH